MPWISVDEGFNDSISHFMINYVGNGADELMTFQRIILSDLL